MMTMNDSYRYRYCPQQRRRRRRRKIVLIESSSTTFVVLLMLMMATSSMLIIFSSPLMVVGNDVIAAAEDDDVTNTASSIAAADEHNDNDGQNDNVCDSNTSADASSNTCGNSSVDDDNNNNNYESPDIEWCRRRPTWRNDNDENNTENTENENYNVRERCSKILNYYPNLELLTKGRHPYLSSSYTPKYKFSNHDDIFNEMNKQKDTYNTISNVLERPLIKQLYECMDDDDELQNELWISNIRSNNSRMVRPNITKIHRRRNDNDDDDENDDGDGDGDDNNDDGLPVMIIVENAITELEAQYVISLSKCLNSPTNLKEYVFEQRIFEETIKQTDDYSGNDVTFLAGFLQILLPGIANQIHQIAFLVWNETKWGDDEMEYVPINTKIFELELDLDLDSDSDKQSQSQSQSQHEDDKDIDIDSNDNHSNKNKVYSNKWWPDPRHPTMGIRTTEHLSYDKWGGLGYHEDSDSDYTVLIALSNPDDYIGGEFTIFTEYDYDNSKGNNKGSNNNNKNNSNPKNKISFKPNRLSAIVFLSEFQHGVESITTSGRVTFANELWRYDDSPAFIQRPSPVELVFGDPYSLFSFDDDRYKYPYGEDEDEYGHYRDDNDDDNDDNDDHDDNDNDDDHDDE
jgi:hypothetical protein